jgi:hypothetical protein
MSSGEINKEERVRKRRSPSPRSPGSGRILGAVGIAMIAIAVLGVVFVLVNRPVSVTTAAPAQSGPPPATSLARLPAGASQTPIENEHSHVPDDEETEDEADRPKRTASPSPSRSEQEEPPSEQPRPAITEDNLPAATDLAWRATGDWQEQPGSQESGDQVPSVCLPSVTVLANPTTLLRRDYTLSTSGHGTALIADYATDTEASDAYTELRRSVRDCPTMLRQQGYLQPSPVAAKPVPLPEGIIAEHLRLEYQQRQSKPATESIGLVLAGNRLLMVSMVTPAADTTWAKDPAGQPQDHPMMRTLPVAAGRLIA